MHSYNTSADAVRQDEEEELHDYSASGRERPWKEHKMHNQLLAAAYDSVDPAKAERLRGCATFLSYQLTDNGKKVLADANFCRVRLCPICSWRRSLKVYSQMTDILAGLRAEGKHYGYLMLTLTMRNVPGAELNSALTALFEGYRRLMMYARVKAMSKGAYRGAEITHNLDPDSPYYDTFHPHIHVLIATNKSYFTDKRLYMRQEEWTSLWRRALKADYDPIVHIQKCKGETAASIAEVAKYAVKSGDYIIPDDWDMTIDTVRLLDGVLNNRRFISFSGEFKRMAAKLKLDDAEEGDLLHVAEDSAEERADEAYINYIWHTGYNQYLRD